MVHSNLTPSIIASECNIQSQSPKNSHAFLSPIDVFSAHDIQSYKSRLKGEYAFTPIFFSFLQTRFKKIILNLKIY